LGPLIVAALICGAVVQHNRDKAMPRAKRFTLLFAPVALARRCSGS
jgi:hypothetical protein